ncbi:MAG: LytTR family DNA-binding domain-containing protein [Flavobacteriales bacterium]
MVRYTCIIIEDEPLAAEKLQNFLSQKKELECVGVFHSGEEGLSFLQNNKVDLVFLDIQLGDANGMDILKEMKTQSQFIMTTANPQYAVKGFDLNVVDYLLKPFGIERWEEAIHKALMRLGQTEQDSIFVKSEYRQERIYIHDILYIEGMGDYRRIHTTSKRIMTLQTFGELETMLQGKGVVRIHKSYMVNVSRITEKSKGEVKIGEVVLPVSATYRATLGDW